MSQAKAGSNPGAERFADSTMPDLAKPAAGGSEPDATQLVLRVDTAGFTAVVERSKDLPVILVLTAEASKPSLELAETMAGLVVGYGGRLLMGTVDLVANPQIAQVLGIQAVPTVLALIKGQPVPLFQGMAEAEQIKSVLDQVLQAAAQAGVNGQVTDSGEVEVPLPPLHQAGYEALEAGDLAKAREAFTRALAEAPADGEAKAALAQIGLLERLDDAGDGTEESTTGLAGVMAAADADVAAGQAETGFNRLLALLPGVSPAERETIRLRLLELFEVAGADSSEVAKARRLLAAALF